ncbi:MAG: zinc-binding dehydrogenase [Chloroflexota bacterium]|nr:zinc-binding dehydrogenase [Chloroflexota bacterium]
MKAVYIESHGGPEALQYGERPEPSIQPHEVKVRVRACSLNRLDTYVRAGVRGQKRSFPPPHIPGGDCAGEIAEVGAAVQNVVVGQRVAVNPRFGCGVCRYCLAGDDDRCPRPRFLGTSLEGSYAEYVAVPATTVYPIADSVSFEEAAALPTTFLPVWNILVRRGALKPWETALALSASAGVGAAAIQVAKRVVGARVIATTSSPEKAERALALGADAVIDYTREDVTQRVMELTGGQGADVVVDHVGAQAFPKAFAALARGGRYGVCGVTSGYEVPLQMGALFTRQVSLFGVFMGSQEDMRQVTAMLNRGVIHPTIDHVFPLAEAADAHRLMESRAFFGKIVLKV